MNRAVRTKIPLLLGAVLLAMTANTAFAKKKGVPNKNNGGLPALAEELRTNFTDLSEEIDANKEGTGST